VVFALSWLCLVGVICAYPEGFERGLKRFAMRFEFTTGAYVPVVFEIVNEGLSRRSVHRP
jgi:uncharacterized membrane protein YhdT